MLSKAEIRKIMIARRQEMPAEEKAPACGYLCDKLASVTLPESPVIAVYQPIRGEVDINQIISTYRDKQYPVLLPSVSDSKLTLDFLEWRDNVALIQGKHGIPEAQGGQKRIPSVILVPLVAFDRAGNRLGYGAGHYDATISSLRKNEGELLTIGIGYSFQEVDKLPAEAHDMKLDMIVTDKDIITI